MKNIKWTYDEYEFYNARMLQVILLLLVKKEKADEIHEGILKEISEFQSKEKFLEKMTQILDKSDNL
jgi:mannitol/fructose-specific phosphotransferase system IIA component (Ntr-type)